MAAVRVEAQVAGDIRFEVLAKLAGLADADHAIGKMVRLWRACTDHNAHVLTEAIVAAVVDPAALVEAGLGERVEAGIRIRGTRGRIEWLAKKRKASKKGGASNKAKWQAKREPSESLMAIQSPLRPDSPPAPAPAPAPATSQEREKIKICRPAPPAPDRDALDLADQLRAVVVASKPNHRIGDEASWRSTRIAWARVMTKLLKRRTRPQLEAALRHQRDHAGQPFALVVESAKALDEKLDRIEVAMSRPAATTPRAGHFQVTGDEQYAGREVKL